MDEFERMAEIHDRLQELEVIRVRHLRKVEKRLEARTGPEVRQNKTEDKILAAISRCGPGNMSQIARITGLTRKTVWRRMQSFGYFNVHQRRA